MIGAHEHKPIRLTRGHVEMHSIDRRHKHLAVLHCCVLLLDGLQMRNNSDIKTLSDNLQ